MVISIVVGEKVIEFEPESRLAFEIATLDNPYFTVPIGRTSYELTPLWGGTRLSVKASIRFSFFSLFDLIRNPLWRKEQKQQFAALQEALKARYAAPASADS
jgi:hypothetical protein